MTALEQLDSYLRRVETRLRLSAAAHGFAVVAGSALLLTLLMVWIGNQYRFAQSIVLPLRILLFLTLAVAISCALALPLWKLNRKRVTRLAEQRVPGFGERLLTVTERRDAANPFTELVAEDAMRVAAGHGPEHFTKSRSLFTAFGAAAAAAGFLIWLIAAGPGNWGYGASLLWTGAAHAGERPLYEVLVQPGDKTVRRKSDQLVTADLLGFSARQVELHARYGGAAKWESTAMQARSNGSGYQFVFAGLADPVEYYVQADAAQSKHFKLAVRDLPGVKRLRVHLHYPSGLGLKDVSEDPGGDIRTVEGTEADIAVLTDRPLDHGVLMLNNNTRVELTKGDGNWLSARLPITKDGAYHIAAVDSGDTIRISDDYYIEAKKDEAPSVRISHPGSDPHVTPIEELPVTVEAADDFGVEAMDLHYSVKGGPEQTLPLLKAKGSKQASGTTMLSLENFKMVPGDLVSLYATARDAKTTSRSDIVFAQAEPFDFKFSQSQQAGGGGGMGNQETKISERQKQIIAATWNEIKSNGGNRAALQEDARFLSDLQGKLGEQAKALAERMASREMAGAGPQFENFSKMMTQASSDMNDAVAQLKPGKWHEALPPEQKALQSLTRAESMFRDIQVAFGQQGGGGGGGGAQRDLARMFDLELDTSKNQYETGQSEAQSAGEQQKAIDEAFEKLKALARRQQELAAQNNRQQPVEQRWQEEQLRREAEELRRQMEELAQNSQGQQSQQNGSQSGQSSSSSSSSSSPGQSSAQNARPSRQSSRSQSGQRKSEMSDAMRQSSNALQRAEDEMRKAVSEQDATAQRRAAADLAEAQNLLSKALHQQAGDSVADLAQKSQEIASAQRGIANRMKQMYGQQAPGFRRNMRMQPSTEGGEGMPEMNDPNNPRYYGYGRRNWQPDPEPPRQPTEQEKMLAGEKERLAQQLEQLQRQMQQQGQSLAATQPAASSKMRKALSDAEQKELALRMQKNAEWMRQGYGDRNLNMENNITAGVDQLSRDLQDVQQAVKAGNQADKEGQDDRQSEALSQIRALRQMLERAQQNAGKQSGQPGQQQGQEGGGEGTRGQYAPAGGPGEPGSVSRGSVRDAIGQLNALRGQIDPRDRALRGYVDDTLGILRNLNADPNILQATINQDAVTRLERLEVELGRRLGESQAQGARSGAPEPSPEKYRDAVAEYFKKLSQPR